MDDAITYLVLGAMCLFATFAFWGMTRAVQVDSKNVMRRYGTKHMVVSRIGLWICAFLDIYTAIMLASFLFR